MNFRFVTFVTVLLVLVFQVTCDTKGGSTKGGIKGPSKRKFIAISHKQFHLTTNKLISIFSYIDLPPSKGGQKGFNGGLKGLIKPAEKTEQRRLPSKGLPPKPIEQQKIEQTQQQEEEPVQQEQQQLEQEPQKFEQEVQQQQEEQKPETKGRASTLAPKKVGIVKWEQRIEELPAKKKLSYVPRKSLLRPQVMEVQQQVQQQEEDSQQPAEQQLLVEDKPRSQAWSSKELKSQQQPMYQNVRQVPNLFNSDAGWE